MMAKVNSALWRFRINFIPLNLLVIFGLGATAVATWQSAIDAVRNAHTPFEISLDQIRSNREIIQNYVRVNGVEVPVAVYQYGSREKDGSITRVEKSWFPLLDNDKKYLLLIQRTGTFQSGQPHPTTITGMLRPMESDIRVRLAATNDQIEGIPVETRYMLIEDEGPGELWISGLVSALAFFSLLCIGIASVKRNTVFQPDARRLTLPQTISSEQFVRVGATGRFSLDGKIAQRFVDMPAVLSGDQGFPLVMSNIDASRRFMGAVTSKRAGIWIIPLKPGTVRNVEFGFLYFGLSRRPAFRFSYEDQMDSRRRTGVLTADGPNGLGVAAAIAAQGSLNIPTA
jgi:hypothetical protein